MFYSRLDPDAENFEIDNQYQIPGLLSFKELDNEKATGDYVQDQDYIGKIKELQASLDMVHLTWPFRAYFPFILFVVVISKLVISLLMAVLRTYK